VKLRTYEVHKFTSRQKYMNESFIFKRRNRLKKHFINVSNVLLYGYKALSDAAKITYQVIEGFDWEDKDTGDSKGFVFPSIETISAIRNAAKRTIFRHIKELEKVGLLTRVRRRNLPSVLYIEEVSDVEANSYLARFVDKTKLVEKEKGEADNLTSAKNGSSHKKGSSQEAQEMPKMAVAYKEQNEQKKENEINVNGNFKIQKPQRGTGIDSLRDILTQYGLDASGREVAPRKKGLRPEQYAKREYIATELATEFNDTKSLGCYRSIAEKVPEHVVFEVRSAVIDAYKSGSIRQSRGALFVGIIQEYCERHGIDLGFQRESLKNEISP
jgi:hypothetical protein